MYLPVLVKPLCKSTREYNFIRSVSYFLKTSKKLQMGKVVYMQHILLFI